MKFVLDTNFVSELMRGEPRATAILQSIERDAVSIPQPVLAEIAYGIARLAESKRKRELATRFAAICEEIGRCVWGDQTSEAFGTCKVQLERTGKLIEDFDIAIAAHALAEGATLLTANLKHFKRVARLSVRGF